MNWYTGNISEAVKLSQQKNAIFVVYVEGNDELSTKMGKFINEHPRIKELLESEYFLAIRVETGSEPYMQFAQIYQLVPSPSMFFIGKNGTPLEIATGILESADDLVKKIENVLKTFQESQLAQTPIANFISREQAASSIEVTDSTTNNTLNTDNVAVEDPETDHAEKLEKARKIIETKRKEKEFEEDRLARAKEIERRKLGKNIQSFKEKQKEEELQKLKEERIRDRLEEQIARQRILEKIANDKAERAQKFSTQINTAAPVESTKLVESVIPKPAPSNSDTARIQFRTPDGKIHTHIFDIKDEFKIIRNYVANTVLEEKIIDFQLATTFPKREFTMSDDSFTISELGLYPSALILIFCNLKSTVKPSVPSGQILTMFHSWFMSAISPIFVVFGYFRRLITGNNNVDNNAPQAGEQPSFGGVSNTIKGFFTGSKTGAVGAQKRANDDNSSPNDDAKKRNINRLISGGVVNDGASTSNDSKSTSGPAYRRSNVHRFKDLTDSDDENATWNGNSTQQQ